MQYEIAVDIDDLKLESVNEDNAGLLFQIVMDWYKQWGQRYIEGIPNIETLMGGSGEYSDMIYDPVAFTITDRNGWSYDGDGFYKAMELISEGFDTFQKDLEKDILKILNHSQLFYATAYETVIEDDEVIYWENKGYAHMPLQEVW